MRGVINISTATTTTLVAAVPGKTIRMLRYDFIAAGAVNVTFKSDTTPIAGPYACAANGGIAPPESLCGIFETASGEALKVTTDAAVQLGGCFTYQVL